LKNILPIAKVVGRSAPRPPSPFNFKFYFVTGPFVHPHSASWVPSKELLWPP